MEEQRWQFICIFKAAAIINNGRGPTGNPNFLSGRIVNSRASYQKLGFPERKDFTARDGTELPHAAVPNCRKSAVRVPYFTILLYNE